MLKSRIVAVCVMSALFGSIVGCPPRQTNRNPDANAGEDQTVRVGTTVVLDASNSTDPDNDDLDFRWRQTSGGTVQLNNSSTENASFNAPLTPGVLIFEVTVDDDKGGEDTDTVSVNVTL